MRIIHSILLSISCCMVSVSLPASTVLANITTTLPKKSIQSSTTFKNWGQSVDPSEDSQFIFGRDNLSIVVGSGDHALAVERGQINAPRLLKNVAGDFTLQVRISGDYPKSATTKVPARRPFYGTGILLWQDENNYIRLERASVVAQGKQYNYISYGNL